MGAASHMGIFREVLADKYIILLSIYQNEFE